jgi:hypothetical protein
MQTTAAPVVSGYSRRSLSNGLVRQLRLSQRPLSRPGLAFWRGVEERLFVLVFLVGFSDRLQEAALAKRTLSDRACDPALVLRHRWRCTRVPGLFGALAPRTDS